MSSGYPLKGAGSASQVSAAAMNAAGNDDYRESEQGSEATPFWRCFQDEQEQEKQKHFRQHAEKFLRLAQVEEKSGLKKSAIYELMSKGEFPRPYRLTERAVGWKQSEIEQWMATRVAA